MTQAIPTVELYQAGQSPWLDNISRKLLRSGRLKQMIDQEGLLGITSNPSIFQKAISDPSAGYQHDTQKFLNQGKSTLEIYDALTIADIRETCDLFLPVYERTRGEHGFVSLEVLPTLAYDHSTTVQEAKRLFAEVDRPNVMIKVPSTPEGISAVRELLGCGVNINITLMFSLKHYQDVAHAYLDGLENYLAKGGDLSRLHSVASVFVSRIDSLVDKKLDGLIAGSKDSEKTEFYRSLQGKAAVANSKIIYQEFRAIFGSARFKKLQAKGAHVQKPLWGSTSTKNPKYPDLLYVETLVGRDTVNTIPQPTYEALLEHGQIRPDTVEENLDQAREVITMLQGLGVDLIEAGEKLQRDGVKAFTASFDQLMQTIEAQYENHRAKKNQKSKSTVYKIQITGEKNRKAFEKELEKFQQIKGHPRFFEKDPGLWKKDSGHKKVIENRLGWLRAAQDMQGKLYQLEQLRKQMTAEKVQDVVLLGMGGSSLAPEVLSLIGKSPGPQPRFYVLDTTDPASILGVEKKIRLKKSLFVVASKSGSTVETLSQFYYFHDRLSRVYGKKAGPEAAGRHFIAVTDDGSLLEKLALEKQFREVFINPADIGGRYSALSYFGLVPAALLGLDVRAILRSARCFYEKTERQKDLRKNPAFLAGIALGAFQKSGRDKIALITSSSLSSFAAWTEQLIAESTGKEGKGIFPIEGEALMDPKVYGKDRACVVIRLKSDPAAAISSWTQKIRKAGIPVLETEWPDRNSIGEAFLFWEIVTAAASAVMGVNPFDEPNVKESKENTAKLLKKFEQSGRLPRTKRILKQPKDFALWGKEIQKRDYLALLAYVERTPATQKALRKIQAALSKQYAKPVLAGFGPRYLHSIGQLYKGGPRTGAFMVILKRDAQDMKVPGKKYRFSILKQAQALGDYQALESKRLPVAAVEIGKDTLAGLAKLNKQL